MVSAEGPLGFSLGDYQIWPTSLQVVGEPAVTPVRPRNPGEFTVATHNLLRLFDTVNDPDVDDPNVTTETYAIRLAKASLHIREVLGAPDVLARQEVENVALLTDLANRIAGDDPTVSYAPYLLEGNDVGGIDVGYLVRSTATVESVSQFGATDTFTFNGTTDGYVDVMGRVTGNPDTLGALLPATDVVDPNLTNGRSRPPSRPTMRRSGRPPTRTNARTGAGDSSTRPSSVTD